MVKMEYVVPHTHTHVNEMSTYKFFLPDNQIHLHTSCNLTSYFRIFFLRVKKIFLKAFLIQVVVQKESRVFVVGNLDDRMIISRDR